ncbi:MAG: urease accessory UreF family protein [Limisphaerales bacterium]
MRPIEKRPQPVLTGSPAARSEAENLLGEFSALLRQVGVPIGGITSRGTLTSSAATKSRSPEVFLKNYLEQILLPLELPAIAEACGHAARGEIRELILQDQRLGAPLRQTPFAGPSQQVGRSQLMRMRPLRDDRLVQRYLKAVESGQAHGWHTLVYGVTLAVYSVPLRQGLLFYGQEALASLAGAAADETIEPGLSRLLEDLTGQMFAAVAASLATIENRVSVRE